MENAVGVLVGNPLECEAVRETVWTLELASILSNRSLQFEPGKIATLSWQKRSLS